NCTNSELRCQSERNSTKCIPRDWVMDGVPDCGRGTDELTALVCDQEKEFQCVWNGRCIPRYRVNDDYKDCEDGSDEEGSYQCENSLRCIPRSYLCDGLDHCGDCSDNCSCDGITECRNMEDECSERANCENKPKFCNKINEIRRCSGLYNFVFGFSVCNGMSECLNGEDERNCTERFICDAGQRTKNMVSIANSQKCDAVYPPDCLDSSDEINCSDSTHFYCESGTPFFVRRDQVVDGKRDCADASDECPPDMFQTNALSSREELIKVPFLRAMVWFMAFVAIIGNSKSLIKNSIKAQNARAPGVVVINKLLILNLSIADLLMGIALLIIGIKSAQFSGQYCWRDLLWRSSTTCDVIGILSVLSCEASVLSLVCLTSYRVYMIYFPFKSTTVSTKVASIWIMCIWVVCFILALLPLVDQLSRYMVETMLIKTTPYLTTEIIRFNQLLEFTKRISATQQNNIFWEHGSK
uniref:G-protein coupled receptors family 1 profile domain-containing protein n=1 Tax=Ciona intestinalis TaxID=7719 RepID=H2XY79_CIOIN